MSLITLAQVKLELDIETTNTSYDTLLEWLILSVESIWDTQTNKAWFEATYLELISGDGSSYIFLKNMAVSAVSYIHTAKSEALQIKNTTNYATASVSTTSTGLSLSLNGSATALAYADYSTITDLSDAINALGSGWVSIMNLTNVGASSALIIEALGLACHETAISLFVPDSYMTGFTVLKEQGIIRAAAFPYGIENIGVKYTAGYTADTCPAWLKQILIRQTSHWYLQSTEKRWHVSSMMLGEGGTIAYKNQKMNLLPDFNALAETNRKANV